MPPARGRRWLLAALATLLPCLLLAFLEAGLRVAGFGESYPLFVPVPDAPDFLQANPRVVARFMVDEQETPKLWIRPVPFPRRKGAATFRIFVQGESTAEGYPYGYGASPAGMLQQRLQRSFPERDIQVITTAMPAVNSYTLLDFSTEILAHDPDAVVIYAGHNEYVGLLGVGSRFSVGRLRPMVLAFLRLDESRIFQLGRRALRSAAPRQAARDRRRTLMATIAAEKRIPYGSPLYRRGLDQYRANLRALLRRYRLAGVPVFIGTLVANERDQAPFISGHGAGTDIAAWRHRFALGDRALERGDPETALAEFTAAVSLDDANADGHFGRGRALERLGRTREARQAYLAASDRDQLRFRAPTEINVILRAVAAEQGAHVVEIEGAFVRAARDGIIGRELMLEHLHPNLEGYFVMADAFYEALRAQALIGPWENAVPRAPAWREMPVTEVDRLYGEFRIGHLTSDWPFVKRQQPFRLDPPAGEIAAIAQSYFHGRSDWPAAMRDLLEHYRSVGADFEAATVAVLLAEAFPARTEDQRLAAELLLAAGRPGTEVYERRARVAAMSVERPQ